ncbi:cell division protein FtsQ/DivIB [Undibacterium terreum]|uniref:Cell division protein FtsQ n=1 Tax=Undibacterium terreum TaxID=1224302 RepID=A0A916XLP8_9BURK|nr:cell division protein FtsQ/DivIB [Undibacterium terreum]GGC81785.1 cell division protein FtsQ [Undibacterium terreum]
MWQDVKLLNTVANTLFAVLLLLLLASGVWWLIQRPMFTLKVIRIEPVQQEELRHVNTLTIRDGAIPRIKGNFFTTNLDSVRTAFEAVPWVSKASVQREWPNKLIVTLEEHTALGTWGEQGRLLSVKGDVFSANLAEAEEDADLIAFDGPDGSEKEVLARYQDLKSWFSRISLAPDAVQYSNRYAWSVKLNNGMRVELGREQTSTTLKERVDRLLTVYPQLVASLQESIESVDMRYPNGLALKSSQSFGTKGKRKPEVSAKSKSL